MIFGVGIDLIEIERINKILKKNAKPFCNKILSTQEQKYYQEYTPELIAKIWSAKEAFVKALGTGFREGITLPMISVINEKIYPDEIILNFMQQHKIDQIALSYVVNDIFALSSVMASCCHPERIDVSGTY